MLPYHVESWIWYGFVSLVAVTRFISRIKLLRSPKKLQLEDYAMAFVFALYTVLIVFLNIVLDVQTNLMTPDEVAHLTPQSVKDRRFGSKMVLLVEQCMCATIWGCKACLLLMYWRLTLNLKQNLAVKAIAIYVTVTFVIMEILYFAYWCRPFNQYWAVPTHNLQCSTATHHLAVNLAFNLSSDIMILCVPLPMLVKLRLPLVKKVALCSLFSLGIFVMICAMLSKYYSFTQPFSPIWEWWYTREASTAVLVANIPHCWSLFREIFRLRSFIHGRTVSDSLNGGSMDRLAERRSNVGNPDVSLNQTRSTISQSIPAEQLSFERAGVMEAKRDTGTKKEDMSGNSVSSTGDAPQGRLEMELQRLEQDAKAQSHAKATARDRVEPQAAEYSSWQDIPDDVFDVKGTR